MTKIKATKKPAKKIKTLEEKIEQAIKEMNWKRQATKGRSAA
jgi:hypothetical protein